MSAEMHQLILTVTGYRRRLEEGWALWSAVYEDDAASVILRRGQESIAALVPGLKPEGQPIPQRDDPKQTP